MEIGLSFVQTMLRVRGFSPCVRRPTLVPVKKANISTMDISTFSYHIISGDFGADPVKTDNGSLFLEAPKSPREVLGRTLLHDRTVAQLEGNKSQVIAWTNVGGDGSTPDLAREIRILDQPSVLLSLLPFLSHSLAGPMSRFPSVLDAILASFAQSTISLSIRRASLRSFD